MQFAEFKWLSICWSIPRSKSEDSFIGSCADKILQGAPKWRNEYGKTGSDVDALRKEAESVAMPSQDPVNGHDGPLLSLWA